MPIIPVILSGGAGTRLWPLSRPERPKQLLSLTAPETMLQLTAARVADRKMFGPALVVAGAMHEAEIVAQLASAGDATLILEPVGRNTAPAIALAALVADPTDLLLVMPSDHLIGDVAAFHAAIAAGRSHAEDGWLVTFGMTPTAPETGFGYIERGDTIGDDIYAAARFVEKPDAATAQTYLESGKFLWNGGIFLMRASAVIDALAAHAPDILDAVRRAVAGGGCDGRSFRPRASAFESSPSASIDVAVMERAERVAVVSATMGWSDVGSWDALYDVSPKDADGSSLGQTDGGNVLAIDCRDLLVRAEGIDVTAIDIHGLTIVATRDQILIMPRGSSQRVREAVAARAERSS